MLNVLPIPFPAPRRQEGQHPLHECESWHLTTGSVVRAFHPLDARL